VIDHCFHDADVLELVRRQWGALGPLHSVSDRYGNRLDLLRQPAPGHTYLVSPYQAGLALAERLPDEVRADNLLEDLVARLLASVEGERHLRLEVRIPAYFFEGRPHALLEPFLVARFAVELSLWQRLVDLADDPEALLAHTTTMARRKIRQGLREAPKVGLHYAEPAPPAVLRALYEAALQTREAGGGRLRHAPSDYAEARARLIADGKLALMVLEHEGATHYATAFVSRELGFYLDGAWTGARSDWASHYLQYRMMLLLKELGCRRYSLGVVFPTLLARSPKAQGIARFKHGLGATLSPIYVLTLARGRGRSAPAGGPLSRLARRLRTLGGRARRAVSGRR
jgi:hypothetical protein